MDTVADRAMTWRSDLLRIILVRATSNVGPLPGSWIMWISSAITSFTPSIHLLPCLIMESLSSESRSPVLM